MSDGRIARSGFHIVNGPLVRAADQGAFHTTMLVPQRDLQMKDIFAVALKPEVAWLDHTGMHRPDGHLVDIIASNGEEVSDAGKDRCVCRPIPSVMTAAVGT